MSGQPQILPMRARDEVITRILRKRLDEVLPIAMREAGIDMWLILCQEDDLDPVFRDMIPLNTWTPILQMLIFFDGEDHGEVERINLSMTNMGDLYDTPWDGRHFEEQWKLLAEIIEDRDPQKIGINIGRIQWAAGGLSQNLYTQLVETLEGKYVDRLVSAEPVVTRWSATLTDEEIDLFEHVVRISKYIIAECYSRQVITPGVTTTTDLEWYYWQRCTDFGIDVSFKPFFRLVRNEAVKVLYGDDDQVIRPGDFIHCDVGVRYLRINSDHQQWAYILKPGEADAPGGFQALMAKAHQLQELFMSEFRAGLTGNQLLENILERARGAELPNPKVYSHSLGHYLHQPGPLIGLPWEQEKCAGRGEVVLKPNYAFTMELSVRDAVPEWNGQEVNMAIEEDVVFSDRGCYPIGGRQRSFLLV